MSEQPGAGAPEGTSDAAGSPHAEGWGEPQGAPGYGRSQAADAPPAPAGGPQYGGPQYGQPQYGQPQYGQPQYGQPQYGQPQYGQPQYGQPQYGQPQYGQPQYGQPQYGQPQYGQPGGGYGQPQYGAPAGYQAAPLQPGIVPLRPLGFGEVLDGAFRSVRANPRVMFGLPAMVVAIATVFGLLLAYALMPTLAQFWTDVFGTAGGGLDTGEVVDIYSMATGVLPGSWLIQFLSTTVLTGLLTASVSRSVIGQTISVSQVWSQYGRRALLLIPYTIAVGAVQLLGMALLLGPGLFVLLASDNVSGGVALLLLGVLAWIVLLAWFTVRTLLVPPTLVLEGHGVWASVVRGWTLSRGAFWRIAGIYLVASILVGIVQQLIATPIGFIGGLVLAAGSEFGYLLITMLAGSLGMIVSLAFLAPVVALLYIDVRMRNEGLDIELARAAEAG